MTIQRWGKACIYPNFPRIHRRQAIQRSCVRDVGLPRLHGRHRRNCLAQNTGRRGLNLGLEAGDQLAVGGDQRLLAFDLADDGLLGGEGREGNLELPNLIGRQILEYSAN
jgi:hypothetical protein